MDSSPIPNFEKSSATPVKSVSVHRAFVYSAGLPGLGEFYAGSRIRGLATGMLFFAAVIWFCTTFFTVAVGLLDRFMAGFQGTMSAQWSDLPLFALGASFGTMYIMWLWAIISAVDTAVQYRREYGLEAQSGVAWAVALAWICPGAGNVYAGSRRYGYMLFCANLLAFLALVPAYLQLFSGLLQIVNSSNFSPNNPYPIIALIHGLMVRLGFSFGKLYQAGVRYIAIAGTISDLSQKHRQQDRRWTVRSIPYGAALLGLGWLAPGSGQILQKRYAWGWSILALYIGSRCLTGVLLGNDLITVRFAESLAWVSIIIQWSAMLEAVLRMRRKQDN